MSSRSIFLSYLVLSALSAAALIDAGGETVVTRGLPGEVEPCEVPAAARALPELTISFAGLLFAAALVAWVFYRTRGEVRWKGPAYVTVPAWTPRSWSSNLAIGGALLSALLALAALPEQTCFISRAGYTVLDATYSAFVALAAAVYGLLKADRAPTPRRATRLFAFAAAVTAWATLGQLLTAATLFLELEVGGVIGWPSAVAADALLLGVIAAVMIYTFRCVASYFDTGPGGQEREARASDPPREWALL